MNEGIDDMLSKLMASFGELRGSIGIHLGILAAMYGIVIDESLEGIIPAGDSEAAEDRFIQRYLGINNNTAQQKGAADC